MANVIKAYFLAPTWDYPPNGPIALGNIIAKPSNPSQPLNATNRLPIPVDSLVQPSVKTDWEWVNDKLRQGKIGIWARFLQALGIAVDVGVSYDNSNEKTYAFDRMETSMFTPTEEYVEESMRAPGVVRFIEKSNYKKPVYMITGLRIVHGARVTSLKGKGHDAQFSVGVRRDTYWSSGVCGAGSEDLDETERWCLLRGLVGFRLCFPGEENTF